jgi:hypothetical protein
MSVKAKGEWPPKSATAVDADAGSGQQLRAYRTESYLNSDGKPALLVTLYWTGNAIGERREVSVKLVNAAGKVLAESRNEPVDGWAPTDIWQTGDEIQDEHELVLPADSPAADFRIRVNILSSGKPLLPDDLQLPTVSAN